MKQWTVVGVYLDDHVWIEFVDAETAAKAVVAAAKAKYHIAGVVEVFEGKHPGQLCNPVILWQEERKKLREEEAAKCSETGVPA